ncbi:MAG: hypothetical protein R1F54_02395 [Candidatus Zeuxoniibacter abyssi]|nr:MAG: hypothetical protein R1F54_02395 [Candidatus Persebacteraceae bacterium AB1(2)]
MARNLLHRKDGIAIILAAGAFLIFATMGIRQSFGLFYDAIGSHDSVWYFCIALGVVAALLHYPIKERPDLNFARNF